MVKVIYTYSFNRLSGKPKRFIELQSDCNLKGYGVSADTVTLVILYETIESYNQLNNILFVKFQLKPKSIIYI